MKKTGFDNEKYLNEQSLAILERVKQFDNKLYLEFGGKLIYDMHASRVLPGFDPNVKVKLLKKLKAEADIILCIYAGDIERKKIRSDFGITYDIDVLRLIDDLRGWGIEILAVVITRFEGQAGAKIFKNKLQRRGIKVYTHSFTKGYPMDVDMIVSDEGYGANENVKTTKPLVIVTAPGPGSGKLATCLSQLYHDYKQGIKGGYAKFETFPIWNISLNHPVNVAYEAATADIKDFNMIDPFHLESYGKTSVNYNRDVEVFPVLRRIFEKITGLHSIYKSPTDMGVNRAGSSIIDDAVVQEASRQEVIRRFFSYNCEYALGFCDKETITRIEFIMEELNLKPEDRRVVVPARNAAIEAEKGKDKGHDGIFCAGAIELADGSIVTGKNSPLMHASASLIINAIKKLAEIPDKIHLLTPHVISSIANLKKDTFNAASLSLDLEEVLIALSISASNNSATALAFEKLKDLKGCQVHLTHMPTPGDETGLRRLKVELTSEAKFSSNNLFIS